MRINTSPSAGSTIVDKLKLYEGGTGVTDAASARTVLGVLAATDYNQPNGIAQLDVNSQLSASVFPDDGPAPIGIQGPTSTIVNTTVSYTITNYDIFTTYTISPILGTIQRVGSTIYYTAPAGAGAGGFVINGRTINVTVVGVQPSQPTLAAVDISGSAANTAALVLTGSAFAMNTTSSNTHLNTDWQIATDTGFTSIAVQSLADATNKTTWTSGNLSLSTTYYARCRYRDSASGVSDWSATVTVTTKATYVPNIEQAKMLSSDRAAADRLGYVTAVSGDGDRVVVTALYKNVSGFSQVGQAYVFKRTGSTWAQEAILVNASVASANANDAYGYSADIDATGTRVIIGAPQEDVSATSNVGTAYIYVRSGTTWSLEQKISGPTITANYCFGNAVAVAGDGTRVAISETGNGVNGSGSANAKIRIYLRTGSSWAQETTLNNGLGTVTTLGQSLALDSDATRLVAGAPIEWNSGVTDYTGFYYVYKRTGTSWAKENSYNYSGYAVADYFGISVGIDSTGTRIVVGALRSSINGSNSGLAAVYVRSGTSWSQEQVLTPSDPGTNVNFGGAVAISGDGTFVVISSEAGRQAAYEYRRVNTTWSQVAKVQCSDRLTTGAGNAFSQWTAGNPSQSVSVDNYARTVIVGAPTDNNGNSGSFGSAGALYAYTT